MKEFMSKKRIVFVTVIILLIVTASLYVTYATDLLEGEEPIHDMTLDFDLSDSINRQVVVAPGKTKVVEVDVINTYDDSIRYGVAYSMVSPETLPDGVEIFRLYTSKNSTKGLVDANSTKTVSVMIVNESTSSVTLSFSIVNGYKNGGNLIVPANKTIVEDFWAAYQTLTNLGFTPEKKILTTFTGTSKQDGTTGIYKTEDDLGTSYYFRGNIKNNYVKFGKYTEDVYLDLIVDNVAKTITYSYSSSCQKGVASLSCYKIASAGMDMYWRIVRINGDGSIRLIYDGVGGEGSTASVQSSVGAAINLNIINGEPVFDNAFVGYMYGTPGSTTYAATHENIHDSVSKTVVDTWYSKYLNSYSNYIADAIYCNDRKMMDFSLIGLEEENPGFGNLPSGYSLVERSAFLNEVNSPTLSCSQINDRFTQNPTVSGVQGNGMLEYPVGLITADEAIFAGLYLPFGMIFELLNGGEVGEEIIFGYMNDQTYLTDYDFLLADQWGEPISDFSVFSTMTPALFEEDIGGVASAMIYENLLIPDIRGADEPSDSLELLSNASSAIRPVISLKADAIKSGIGTFDNPFIIWELGDVNRDGILNENDVNLIGEAIVNDDIDEFDAEQLLLADYDEDGYITNADVVSLARFIGL